MRLLECREIERYLPAYSWNAGELLPIATSAMSTMLIARSKKQYQTIPITLMQENPSSTKPTSGEANVTYHDCREAGAFWHKHHHEIAQASLTFAIIMIKDDICTNPRSHHQSAGLYGLLCDMSASAEFMQPAH